MISRADHNKKHKVNDSAYRLFRIRHLLPLRANDLQHLLVRQLRVLLLEFIALRLLVEHVARHRLLRCVRIALSPLSLLLLLVRLERALEVLRSSDSGGVRLDLIGVGSGEVDTFEGDCEALEVETGALEERRGVVQCRDDLWYPADRVAERKTRACEGCGLTMSEAMSTRVRTCSF